MHIHMEPTDQSWGAREMYVRDADGNKLAFSQYELSKIFSSNAMRDMASASFAPCSAMISSPFARRAGFRKANKPLPYIRPVHHEEHNQWQHAAHCYRNVPNGTAHRSNEHGQRHRNCKRHKYRNNYWHN